MDWALLITGLIAAGVSLFTGINNSIKQDETNKQNLDLQKESWEREDTTMQRTKQDVMAAGFSPLTALGNSVGSSSPVSLNSPQLDLSGVSSGLMQAGRAKSQGIQNDYNKAMKAQLEENTRKIKLDNDLNEQTFEINAMKRAAELNKMYKDNELSDASYIALLSELKGNGLSDSTVQRLLDDRKSESPLLLADEDIPENKTVKANIELSDAQKDKIKAEYSKLLKEDSMLSKRLEKYDELLKAELEKMQNEASKIGEDAYLQKLQNNARKERETFDNGDYIEYDKFLASSFEGNGKYKLTLPQIYVNNELINSGSIGNKAQLEEYLVEFAFAQMYPKNKNDTEMQEAFNKMPDWIKGIWFVVDKFGGNLHSVTDLVQAIKK